MAPTVTAAKAYGRPSWKRKTMAAFTWLTLVLAVVIALRPAAAGGRDLVPGTAAPNFTLETLNGTRISLAELRGRPVVLNFWATWCPPCRAEMPALQKAYEQYRDRGLAVVGVNLDETPLTISAFAQRLGVTFPIALDTGLKVTQRYRILPLPTTFFIDAKGVIQDRWLGELSAEQAQAMFRALIEGDSG